jgi:ubiquinone/menaquinone biosynthesis C-methylase UbiE
LIVITMTERTQTTFDFGDIARDYDRWYTTPAGRRHDRFQKSLVRRFLRPALPGERMLDVGCGTGHWSSFFSSLGYDVLGVDIAIGMIAAAHSQVRVRCSFCVGDAHHLPFADGSFTMVASMATLEFVADPVRVLTEMSRCLESGGRMLIGALNRLSPVNRRRLAMKREPYLSAHLFTPKELRGLLSGHGRVRMLVSTEESTWCRSRFRGPHSRRAVRRRGGPKGAFIVAEVRP